MEVDYANIGRDGFPQPAARIYLFAGSDDAIKREAVQRLIEPLLDPSSADFDREDLDPGMTPLVDGTWTSRILSSAAGMPMFSERRIVVVTNIQRLSKEEQDALAAGLTQVCDRSCLILVAAAPEYEAGKPKGRGVQTKLLNAVQKLGTVVICDAPVAADLKSRAIAYLRTAGKTAEPGALEVFVQRALAAVAERGGGGKGGDLHVLTNELEKAIAYTGERLQITRVDALAVGTRGSEENIFAMLDSVGKRDVAAAIERVDEMLRSGDKPEGVAARSFVMLARHLRLLWGAKYLAHHRIGAGGRNTLPSEVQNELTGELQGLALRQAYLLRNLQDQARHWTYDQLRAGLLRVLASDMTMKGIPPIACMNYRGSAGEDPAANLRVLIVELCRS